MTTTFNRLSELEIKKLALKWIPNHQRLIEYQIMMSNTNESENKSVFYSIENALDILKELYPEYYNSLSEKHIRTITGAKSTDDSDDDLSDASTIVSGTEEEIESESDEFSDASDESDKFSDFSE